MSIRKDFDHARESQLRWMQEMEGFMEGSVTFDEGYLSSYSNSELGKWYYERGKELYGGHKAVKKFEEKQIELHKIAQKLFIARIERNSVQEQKLYEELVVNSKNIINLLNEAENQIIKQTNVAEVHDESFVQNHDKQVPWDKTRVLMSKTDSKGLIEYINEYFLEVSGYDSRELINMPHNVVRHPDMPKIIYKMLWRELQEKNPITIIIKNKSKTGKFFWVATDFKTNIDSMGEIDSIVANHRGIDAAIINKIIQPLYKTLLEIEQKRDEIASENYLKGFLEERNRTLDDFTKNLLKTGKDSTNEKQKGFLGGLFNIG